MDKHVPKVNHDYIDHYFDPWYQPNSDQQHDAARRRGPRGGVVSPFPERLHLMLSQSEEKGFESIVGWQPHGRCFIIHKPQEFVEKVMPK